MRNGTTVTGQGADAGPRRRRRASPRKAAAELRADEIPQFCQLCSLLDAAACRVNGVRPGEVSVRHGVGPYRRGTVIFRDGAAIGALYVIRSGVVEIRKTDAEGRGQVLGFQLPGEVIGLDALAGGRANHDAVALATTFMCRVQAADARALAAKDPSVQRHLLRLLSLKLYTRNRLTRDSGSAEGRMAAFLLHLGQRYERCGFSRERFPLGIPKRDIASYLRMAPETASRVLSGFKASGLLALQRGVVTIRQAGPLEQVARALLQ